jgi:MFS family permease
MCSEARRLAEERGALALFARGGELEDDFPFGVARQLFERLLRDAPPGVRRRLVSGPARLAMGAIGDPSGEATGSLNALDHGLYWLTSNLAERSPSVLIVDDAHWADPATLRFLLYLARRIDGLRVLLVVAVRPGGAPTGNRLVQLLGERRAAAIGAYGAVIGAASVCGQLVGGALVQADVLGLGWRVLFLINLPIGVAGVVLAVWVLPRTREESPVRLDLVGLAAITAALIPLLAGLTEGPDRGWPWWALAATAGGALLAVCAAALKARIERQGREPLVPPRLVALRPVRIGLLLVLAFYASNTGFFVVLTFFLQNGLHSSPLIAGLAFAPIGIGFTAASMFGRSREAWQTPLAWPSASAR